MISFIRNVLIWSDVCASYQDTESESLLRSVEGNMETLIPSTSSTPPTQTTSATPPPWVVIKDVRFIMEGSEGKFYLSIEQILITTISKTLHSPF